MNDSYELDPVLGYVPAIPLPFYGRSKWWRIWEHFGCHCGRYFEKIQEYKNHYALNHIDAAEAERLMQ